MKQPEAAGTLHRTLIRATNKAMDEGVPPEQIIFALEVAIAEVAHINKVTAAGEADARGLAQATFQLLAGSPLA